LATEADRKFKNEDNEKYSKRNAKPIVATSNIEAGFFRQQTSLPLTCPTQ
jgi:hypothetical protein